MTISRSPNPTTAVYHGEVPALARRIVAEVALALVDHTPDDRHTDAAARKAAVAALRVLAVDQRSRLTNARRAHLDALVHEIEHPPSPSPERTDR